MKQLVSITALSAIIWVMLPVLQYHLWTQGGHATLGGPMGDIWEGEELVEPDNSKNEAFKMALLKFKLEISVTQHFVTSMEL